MCQPIAFHHGYDASSRAASVVRELRCSFLGCVSSERRPLRGRRLEETRTWRGSLCDTCGRHVQRRRGARVYKSSPSQRRSHRARAMARVMSRPSCLFSLREKRPRNAMQAARTEARWESASSNQCIMAVPAYHFLFSRVCNLEGSAPARSSIAAHRFEPLNSATSSGDATKPYVSFGSSPRISI